MTKQVAKTKKTDLTINTPKNFKGAINAPKPNSIALSCDVIASIAAQGAVKGGLTPLGHEMNSKGGIIDLTIIAGRVHTLESFIDALDRSGLKRVENDRKKYPLDTFRAVLAHRTVKHVAWCAKTNGDTSHKGFGHRLNKVDLLGARMQIATEMVELAEALNKQYKAGYAKLYDAK